MQHCASFSFAVFSVGKVDGSSVYQDTLWIKPDFLIVLSMYHRQKNHGHSFDNDVSLELFMNVVSVKMTDGGVG